MIKKMQFKITKKGRKWLEGINEFYTKGVPIEVNEYSQNWNVGDVVEFTGRIEKEVTRFGTSIKIYPLSEQEVLDITLKQLEENYQKWQGYIEEIKEKGELYEKGIETLREIAKKMGKEKETEDYIKQVKQEVDKIKAEKKYEKLISYIQDPSSYENYLGNYESLKTLVEEHPELQAQFKKDEALIKEYRIKALQRSLEHLLGNYRDNYEKRNTITETNIKDYISALQDTTLQEKYYAKLQEIIEAKEQKRKEFKNKYEEVFKSLEPHFDDDDEHIEAIIKHTLQQYPVYNEKYFLVDMPSKYHYNIMKKCCVIVGVRKTLSDLSGNLEEYLYFVPARKKELFDKLVNLIKNPQIIYDFLNSFDGNAVDIDEALPHYWNHVKGQYIAMVTEEMKLIFISDLYNFTSTKCNANMKYELPQEIGTIIVAKDGSHRHMFHTFYKLTENGWKRIYRVEEYAWKDTVWDIIEDILANEQT